MKPAFRHRGVSAAAGLASARRPRVGAAVGPLGPARGRDRGVLKVARTVAAAAHPGTLEAGHVAEAVQYRRRGSD